MMILRICFYLFVGVTTVVVTACQILWIVLQVLAAREGGRLHLYMTRHNIAEFEMLFLNQSDPSRRRLYLSILHIFKICLCAFLILGVSSFVLFFIYVFYQRSKLG